MRTPDHCSDCGKPFTEDNPPKGGILSNWWCGPCLAAWGKTWER